MKNIVNESDEIDLAHLWWVLWREKTRIGIVGLALAIAMGLISFFVLKPRYESIAVVMENKDQSRGGGGFATGGGLSSIGALLSIAQNQSDLAQYVEILSSRDLVAKMIERYNLWDKFELKKGDDEFERARNFQGLINKIKGSTEIELDKNVMRISFQNKDANLAREMVEWYLESLRDFIQSTMVTSAKSTEVFVEARLREVETELKSIEKAYMELKKKSGVVELSSQLQFTLQTASQLRSEILNKDLEIDKYKSLLRDSKEIQRLEAEKKQLQVQLDQLMEGGTRSNSKISRDSKGTKRADLLTPLREGSSLEIEFSHVERNYSTLIKLAELLRQQLEIARIDAKRSQPVFQVIDPPYNAPLPVFPNKKLNVLMGFFAGILLASMYFILNSFRNAHA